MMTYCAFENLSNDVGKIIGKYEDGVWDDGVSKQEMVHVKYLRQQIDDLYEILQGLTEENDPYEEED